MWRIGIALVLATLVVLALLWPRDDRDARRIAREADPAAVREAPASRDAAAAAPPEEEWVEPEVTGTITGRVFDHLGRAVDHASVSILRPNPYRMVHTDAEGRFELPCYGPGRHLLEAWLTIDLARSRQYVRAGESYEFHLSPAGYVFGELMAAGEPVPGAAVDILEGEKWVLDTTCENGYFTFTDAPPRDVALRLRIRASNAFPTEEVTFVYKGEPVNLGRIVLTHFPAVRVRFKGPDGTVAERVEAVLAASLRAPEEEFFEVKPDLMSLADQDGRLYSDHDLVVAHQKGDLSLRLGLADGSSGVLVVRDVVFRLGEVGKLDVEVRPGPLGATARLVDEHGGPIVARVALEGGTPVETDSAGGFTLQVPYAGVFAVRVTALRVPEVGWVSLTDTWGGAPRPAFLFDAEHPADVVVPLDRRILAIGEAPGQIGVYGEDGEEFFSVVRDESGPLAGLSPPLPPASYRWSVIRGAYVAGMKIQYHPLEFAPSGLTVIDTR